MKVLRFIARAICRIYKLVKTIAVIALIALAVLFGFSLFMPDEVVRAIEIIKNLLT